MAKAASESSPTAANAMYGWVWFGVVVYVIGIVIKNAYKIRMAAIDEFGPVIHEFDPYFNFRATEVSNKLLSWSSLSSICAIRSDQI
jgi:dolichyl-diphosphooligosaccharide--protein glycosyltransferase